MSNSPLAYIVYTTFILAGLKSLGANLTWSMVFFPVWGLGVVLFTVFFLFTLFVTGATK